MNEAYGFYGSPISVNSGYDNIGIEMLVGCYISNSGTSTIAVNLAYPFFSTSLIFPDTHNYTNKKKVQLREELHLRLIL